MDIQFVFSDRHAYLRAAEFSSDLADLNRIDWKILQGRDFRRDPNDFGKVERYQAEALIHRHMPIEALLGIICNGPEQQQRVVELAGNQDYKIEIKALPGWYV